LREPLRCFDIRRHAIQTAEKDIGTSAIEQRPNVRTVVLEAYGRRDRMIEPREAGIAFVDPHLKQAQTTGERGSHTVAALLSGNLLHGLPLDFQGRASFAGIVEMTGLMMSSIGHRDAGRIAILLQHLDIARVPHSCFVTPAFERQHHIQHGDDGSVGQYVRLIALF
jgi:hypothetical protein